MAATRRGLVSNRPPSLVAAQLSRTACQAATTTEGDDLANTDHLVGVLASHEEIAKLALGCHAARSAVGFGEFLNSGPPIRAVSALVGIPFDCRGVGAARATTPPPFFSVLRHVAGTLHTAFRDVAATLHPRCVGVPDASAHVPCCHPSRTGAAPTRLRTVRSLYPLS
jgi:hypothetical protein